MSVKKIAKVVSDAVKSSKAAQIASEYLSNGRDAAVEKAKEVNR